MDGDLSETGPVNNLWIRGIIGGGNSKMSLNMNPVMSIFGNLFWQYRSRSGSLTSFQRMYQRNGVSTVNRIMIYLTAIILCPFISSEYVTGQENEPGKSFTIGKNGNGVSFGNSRRANGLRFNFNDNGIEQINGLNITFWKPYDNQNGTIKGGAIGIWAPDAGIIRGVTLGGLGTRGQDVSGLMLNIVGYEGPENFRGLGLGLIASGAEIQFNGISVAGIVTGGGDLYRGLGMSAIAVGSRKEFRGIALAGIVAGAGESFTGFAGAPIVVGSAGDFTGIAFSGLIAGTRHDMFGFSSAGAFIGAGNNLTGIQAAGIALGARNRIKGISLGGFFVAARNRLSGISAAGIGVGSRGSIHGAAASLLFVGVFNKDNNGIFEGISISPVNYIQGLLNGLTLGIFNYADSVDGLQIGLLNYIASNPRGLQLLPFFNRQFN